MKHTHRVVACTMAGIAVVATGVAALASVPDPAHPPAPVSTPGPPRAAQRTELTRVRAQLADDARRSVDLRGRIAELQRQLRRVPPVPPLSAPPVAPPSPTPTPMRARTRLPTTAPSPAPTGTRTTTLMPTPPVTTDDDGPGDDHRG